MTTPDDREETPVTDLQGNNIPEQVEEPAKTSDPDGSETTPVAEDGETASKTAEFTGKLNKLFEEAKAAGISPAREMIGMYAKRGLRVIDGILDGLTGDDGKPPRKR